MISHKVYNKQRSSHAMVVRPLHQTERQATIPTNALSNRRQSMAGQNEDFLIHALQCML